MGSVRGPRGAALRALVSVAAGLLACGGASEYDYVSYQSDLGPYPGGRFYAKPHQCVAIPADLRLCHSVGYDKMVLPNLLDHETMAEVKHQASSWVPLLNKNCHMGTQVFLCSLFAPVSPATASTAPAAVSLSSPAPARLFLAAAGRTIPYGRKRCLTGVSSDRNAGGVPCSPG
uniref:Secreted frizzled related protein 1 n=1 Tax=Strix occidentalis caurina TaxID=311401 RepID=A0A8D0FHE4_STROC